MYEALRCYFVQGQPSQKVAKAFGYTPGSFRVLCHQFRRDPDPQFFVSPRLGPHRQPKKDAARELIEQMRKQNHSVYEISQVLKERGRRLSPTAVGEVLKEMGFAALPRRLDEEREPGPQPTVEPMADARTLSLSPRSFPTRCGGLFLFVPDLVGLGIDTVAKKAKLPGSQMIPPGPLLLVPVGVVLGLEPSLRVVSTSDCSDKNGTEHRPDALVHGFFLAYRAN